MEENNKKEASAKKSFLKKDFFNKSFALRIISLFCALLLWFYVSAVESPTSEKTFEEVTISLRSKDVMLQETGMTLISSPSFETKVVLSGKKSVLNKIDYEDIVATVDLSGLNEAGDHTLPVKVVAPAGTTLVSSNPRYITVSIDKTVAKDFEIETDLSFITEYDVEDCVITDPQSKPITRISVSGPETEVDKIMKVVAKVDFGVISSSVEARTNLICLDASDEEIINPNIKLTPKSVTVKQPVYTTKTLKLTVKQAYNTFSNNQITINVDPKTIQVKGDPKLLEGISEIALSPINEREILNKRLPEKTQLIKLPDGIEQIDDRNTATINAYLNGTFTKSLKVTEENITIKNIPDNYSVEITSIPNYLTLINASDKEITLDDILLELDLTGCEPGENSSAIFPEFKENQSFAYFTNENGFWVAYKITERVGERQ